MRELKDDELHSVSGGNWFTAVGVGVTLYTVGPSLIDSTKSYNSFGSKVGEYTYNTIHGDQLGPMNFPK